MPLPKLAVDLDGVLADTIVPCCRITNARYSKNLEPESITKWKAWELVGISENEFFRALDDAWSNWRNIPPTEDHLAEKVEKLLPIGIVDIVTGRSPGTVAPAKSWLKEQGIKFNSFVRTNGAMDKLRLNYEIFIDDSPELMAALAGKEGKRGVLYSQPWNREVAVGQEVSRVESWVDIPERVLDFVSERRSR